MEQHYLFPPAEPWAAQDKRDVRMDEQWVKDKIKSLERKIKELEEKVRELENRELPPAIGIPLRTS